MMTFEQWQGQQPVLMVPTQRHQPCATQSRQLGAWEGSCNTWQDLMVQQPEHSEPEQMVSDEQEHSEQQCQSLKASGCKRGGRPVTWIGGGGMDPKRLAGLGVPVLRTLFQQVFGQETASNNAAWLRRKLAEAPDSVHGQRRSPVVRARDQGAAIWNQDHPEGEEQQHLAEIPEEGDMLHHQHMAASVFAAASVQRMSGDDTSLAQQMQLDGAGGPAERRTTPPPSPGAGLMSCDAAAGHTSPGGTTLGKRGRQGVCKQDPPKAPQPACYASGVPIRPDTVSDSSSGRKVLVYWPADHHWWEATLCRVNTSLRQLQLLYADMTEEVVSGRDFDDMLANGHLLDVEDAHAADAAVQLPRMVPLDKAQSAPVNSMLAGTSPSVTACQPGTVQESLAGFRPAFSKHPTHHTPDAGAVVRHAAPGRSVSCLLPRSSNAGAAAAGIGAVELCPVAGVLQGIPVQSASAALAVHDRLSPQAVAAALTHNSSRRSTGDGFRLSGSGSGSGGTVGVGVSGGSGNNSASCEPDTEAGVAAKRQCLELSGNTSDAAAETANPAAEGCSMLAATAATAGNMAPAMPQQQQQQPKLVGDPSQLGLWFANQQLQQLHLQEQVQHNFELQQQAHVQMQQQMAAHMQMRMAGQLMQQQLAAAPFTFAGAAMAAAAAAGMFGLPGTPTTSNCFDAAAAAAAASGGFPIGLPAISAPPGVLAMQQLACSNALGGQLGSPVAAMAAFGSQAGAPAAAGYGSNLAYSQQLQSLQQQQQEVAAITAQLLEPTSPLATAAASAAGAAWPGLAAAAAAADNNQAAMAAAAVGSPQVCNVFGQLPLPQVQVQPAAPLQPALPEMTVADPAGNDAAAAAAAPVVKPVKAVTIKLEPEYTTFEEQVCAAEIGATNTEQQRRVGVDRSGTPAVPAVSGATAGCVSGFTGGAQGGDALDEVDTLLSRPDEGLFSALEGCGGVCGASEGCWSLLGMSSAAADSREEFGEVGEAGGESYGDAEGPNTSSGSQGAGESNRGAEGGFQLPALTGNAGQEGWEAEFGGVSSAAKGASQRPNSALAHVFDYA